jgi:glycosyltransferase involved in cell wall biosynthesis
MAVGPTISLITASFNRKAHIEQCIASVAAQDYPAIEHVVIDGASSDGTLELLRAHQHRFAHLVSEPDHGVYDALNKGLRLASGDVVGFLHTDDYFAAPDILSAIAREFADPAVQAVYGDLLYVSQQDTRRTVRTWKGGRCTALSLSTGWMPPHPTLFVRREIYESIGGFDLRFRIAADYHSIVRMFALPSFRATYLPRVVTHMRTGGLSNRSLSSIIKKSREDWRVIRESVPGGGAHTLVLKNLRKVPQFFGSGDRQ